MSTLPEKHNLSGIYFRFKNPITGEMENRVFEDLPENNMRELLENRKDEWLKEMVVVMASCLHTIADQLGIYAQIGDQPEENNNLAPVSTDENS